MTALSLNDLAATSNHILQSTTREDQTDEDTIITTIFQILLLAYKTTSEEPSLADVLNGHRSYFSTHGQQQQRRRRRQQRYNGGGSMLGSSGAHESVSSGLDEKCYQYILDLALSSERDWWSKLELASSSSSITTTSNKLSKRKQRNQRRKKRGREETANAPDYDLFTTAIDEDTVPPLLSWAAHCWLEASFGTTQTSLPAQLVSYENKEELEHFASEYPGLSRMKLRGRDDQMQPHWWTGRTTTGLSLYLSAATSLHRWRLQRIFRTWFRFAAKSQRQRYRNDLLQRVMERREMRQSFIKWSEMSELTRVVLLRASFFLKRRCCQRWRRWVGERELRRPFAGWVTETVRWRRRLVAFDYWTSLSFVRQLRRGFIKLVRFHASREEELRLGRQRYCFIKWSDVTYLTWESRTYFKGVAENATRVRQFQMKASAFNNWNGHIYRVHCYREGAKKLELVGRMYGRRILGNAVETWYHAYMMNLHAQEKPAFEGKSFTSMVHHYAKRKKLKKNSFLEEINTQSMLLNRAQALGRCFERWLELVMVRKNVRMCEEIAVRHVTDRMMGQAFFKWTALAVEKRRRERRELLAINFYRDYLLNKYFFRGLVMNLIHARQQKIKWLEATMFYQKNLVDQCFLIWRVARLNRSQEE